MAASTRGWFMRRPCRAWVQSPEGGIGSLSWEGSVLEGQEEGAPSHRRSSTRESSCLELGE